MSSGSREAAASVPFDDVTQRRAYAVSKLLERQWFNGRFSSEEDRYLPRLLLTAYIGANIGALLNKKGAGNAMGAGDIKTARKYVARAIEEGLLRAERSPFDKRTELLKPTPLLEELLKAELRDIIESFDHLNKYEKWVEENKLKIDKVKPYVAIKQDAFRHGLDERDRVMMLEMEKNWMTILNKSQMGKNTEEEHTSGEAPGA
jgi:hypothetical protein